MKKITPIGGKKATSQPPKKLRVAAYCRVSTRSDTQLESLEAQKAHYEQILSSRKDWIFSGLYVDEGISGTKKGKRPELLRLLADCEAGKIDLVLTKSISRFSRNITDGLEMVRKLLALHIPVYFEKENLHTASMESELMLSILSGMAECESTSLSQNLTWSIQNRFQQGTFKLSAPPYGYLWDGKQLLVDPEKAPTVAWIFQQVLSGKGTYTIARELQQQGVPTQRGGRWSSSTVLNMIRNEKYIGEVLFQKTYTNSQFHQRVNRGEKDRYAMREHHEPIISREQFEAANALVALHRKEKGLLTGSTNYQNRYAFSGKLFCGHCGNTLKRQIIRSGSSPYAAWACKTHLQEKQRCPLKAIREEALQAAFLTLMNKLIFSQERLLKPYLLALKNQNKDGALLRLEELQTLLLENQKKQETLAQLMAQGYLGLPLYQEENHQLFAQAEAYRAEQERLLRFLRGESLQLTATHDLWQRVKKQPPSDAFDGALFEKTVAHVKVLSRQEVAFCLHCGLTLQERI